MRTTIEWGKDFISIRDKKGEIVRWVMDEWVEDPSVVLSITYATYRAGKGENIRKLIKRRDTLDDILRELEQE